MLSPGKPAWVDDDELSRAWWEFQTAHPEVGFLLHTLATRLVNRGHKHISIKMLWETMRYETTLGARPGEDAYRLNNNHHAYYARWLMESFPALAGIFTLRATRGDRKVHAQ